MDKIKAKTCKTTKHIAEKFRRLRHSEGLSQEDFGAKANLDRRTISRAEGGKFRPANETLEQVADACGVPVSYFYDFSTIREKQSDIDCINEIMADLKVTNSENLPKIKKMIKVINE